MRKNERNRNRKKTHKERKDFDTLFNAQIDETARERRQKRQEKRKKRRTNGLIAAIVKFSKIKLARPVKEKRSRSQAAGSPRKIARPEVVLREIAPPEKKVLRVAPPEITAPEEVKHEAVLIEAAPPEITAPEVINHEEVLIEAAPPEITPPKITPYEAVLNDTVTEKAAAKAAAFWTRSIDAVKRFYIEFTDKEIIDKLNENTQDHFDMFAEIKESLDSTTAETDIQPVTDIQIIQDQNEGTVLIEQGLDVQTQTGEIQASQASEEFFNDMSHLQGEGQAEYESEELVPEVLEAMQEIDKEYVLSILEPKCAMVIDKIDAVLEKYPKKIKNWLYLKLVGFNILPEKFKISKSEKSTFAAAKRIAAKPVVFMKSAAAFTAKGARRVKSGISRPLRRAGAKALIPVSALKLKISSSKASAFLSRTGENARTWCGKERNLKAVSYASVLIVAVFFGTASYLESISAYAVSFMNSPIGIVKDKEDIFQVIPDVEEKLKEEYNAQVFIDPDEDFEFTLMRSRNLPIMTEQQILGKFDDINKINIAAYGLQVDGIITVILPEKAQVENLLAGIKNDYLAGKNTSEFDSVSFGENIQIVPVQTKMMQISDEEEAKTYLVKGTFEEKIHAVQSGETLSGIAKSYGIKTSEIEAANPGIDAKRLQIGQEISLIAPKPFITVETVETRTYIAEVPFDITYEESGSLFQGETTVKSTGKTGEREVTASITRRNGIEVSRVELESTTLKDPVNQVVIKGTKALPALLGTGTFQNPVRGTLSSRYGQRWSRMHQGIDIAAPKGTAIKAADGGTVIYAGYDGAYGNTVRINHGANKVTVYAHCSTISVKQGQKVAKGQQIATVGTTGRTTGPHLHFEVRINGSVKNPLDYVSY